MIGSRACSEAFGAVLYGERVDVIGFGVAVIGERVCSEEPVRPLTDFGAVL